MLNQILFAYHQFFFSPLMEQKHLYPSLQNLQLQKLLKN